MSFDVKQEWAAVTLSRGSQGLGSSVVHGRENHMITFPAGYRGHRAIPVDYTGAVWIEGQIRQLEESIFGEAETLTKPVRVICAAQHAYAGIVTDKRSLDVQLAHGKSAEASLLEEADALEEKALSQLRRARVIRDAAKNLAEQKVK